MELPVANLKDVARQAGVDPSTASRVLRDDPGQQVRPETRQRILDAARELRYRPNALARGLRTRRTDTLGLIIPSLDNLGFADVTHGIQTAAAAAGKMVVVVEADAVAGARNGVYERLIGDGRLDGLMVAFASVDDEQAAQLRDAQIPLVVVSGRNPGTPGSVVVDDERGSRAAVEHLVGLGHRRIGYLGLDADTDTARRLLSGYGSSMARAGIRIDPRWLAAGPPTERGGRAAVQAVLRATAGDPPTALFVANLMSALGALAALTDAGLSVPRDVSLVTFNDHPFAAHTAPSLTTIRMPNFRMGQEAVRMLLGAFAGEAVRDVLLDEAPEVVVRGSTGAPRTSGVG
jgi:LacI family transcriptional regulator